ncbi:MAG TPA: aspartate ammonia-lyase [Actinomycetota bacterium]|nr:aspartate ammonia-lyase [Actinomycetota bacterium]
MSQDYRIERDALGEVRVPSAAYYGAETVRAAENFRISERRPRPEIVRALAWVKIAAARANASVGALDAELADAIARAGQEVARGELADQFLVDPYQGGAGTSTHMNVNEVLASRAEELLGVDPGLRGRHTRVHPNDHVNMGQSSNDVVPTAVRIAVFVRLTDLLASLDALVRELGAKAGEFAGVVKSGRTHLQDAVPITLGKEFHAFAEMLRRTRNRLDQTGKERVARVPLGGTANGTGFGAAPGYREAVLPLLAEVSGVPVFGADDLVEAVRSHGDLGEFAAAMKTVAIALAQICNDLRMLAMGPRTGLAEIRLPEVLPGSSIMPGKVNPSIVEMVNMVCMRVAGAEHTVAAAVEAGQLDMTVMTPVIADELLEVEHLMDRACATLAERCVRGITADEDRCREYAWASLGLATALRPLVGYERAADIATRAFREGRTVRQIAEEEGVASAAELDEALNPARYA